MKLGERTPAHRVCPTARHWRELYEALFKVWETRGRAANDRPPSPLILAAWGNSNDIAKAERWKATLEWASRHGLTELEFSVPDDGWHYSQ